MTESLSYFLIVRYRFNGLFHLVSYRSMDNVTQTVFRAIRPRRRLRRGSHLMLRQQ